MKQIKKKNLIGTLSACALSVFAAGALGLSFAQASAEDTQIQADFFVRSASLRESDDGYAPAVNYKTVIKKSVFLENYAKLENEEALKGENGNYILKDDVKTYTVFAQTSALNGDTLTMNHAKAKSVETTDHWFDATYDEIDYVESIAYVYDIPEDNYSSDISVCAVIDPSSAADDEIYSTNDPASLSLADVAQLAIDQNLTTENKVEKYISFTVNYYVDGSISKTEYKKLGTKLTEPEEPTVSGKWFYNRWLNQDGTKEWDFENDVVSSPVNLYADMRDRVLGSSDTNPVTQVFSASDAKVQEATTQAALASEIAKNGFVAEVETSNEYPTYPSTFVNTFCGNQNAYKANYAAYQKDGSNRYLVVRMFMPTGMEWNEVYYSTGDFSTWGTYIMSMSQIKGGQWVNHIFDLANIYSYQGESGIDGKNPWYYLRTKSGASTSTIEGSTSAKSVVYISDVYFLDAGETASQHETNKDQDGNTWNAIIGDVSEAILKDATTQAALREELAKGSTITELYRCDERTWANNWIAFESKYSDWTKDLAGKYLVLRIYIREDMTSGATIQNLKSVKPKTSVSSGWVDYYFSMDEIISNNIWGFNSFSVSGTTVDIDGDKTAKEFVYYYAGYRIADAIAE